MYKIFEFNPQLKDFTYDIVNRMHRYKITKWRILNNKMTLNDFSNAHDYFGIHHADNGWVYREWAPNAYQLYLTGDFNGWNWTEYPMKRLENGIWELHLPEDKLWDGCKIKTIVDANFTRTEHIPLYARRVTQDKNTHIWAAEVVDDKDVFEWTDQNFTPEDQLYIYEAHVGMAQEEGKVSTYREFADKTLPWIKESGYNTIQLMAIMEHPYYGSFGYQVSNFYAASSWFGKPKDLKYLINKAHEMNIRVLLDVVHSHAVKNTTEGINMFDGTTSQFFHDNAKGEHPAWDTKCFNYGKDEVIHFLLSNLKFWMTEYHFDGFRFDGVTSMIYNDHALETSFGDDKQYFSQNTDVEAITYLQLANELIHEINPNAITIVEDMSGMPGMCLPLNKAGFGFDYRLSMGVPDMWIKLIKESKFEAWDVFYMWHELTTKRPCEKSIAYAESHDQALVGDKTIMFRLVDAEMYTGMEKSYHSLSIDNGVDYHKLIRFITSTLANGGYLNFMGNEFGHPEWIDFPREGNGWSFHYCRRQWSLPDNPDLKYQYLNAFDKDMIAVTKDVNLFEQKMGDLRYSDPYRQVIVFYRKGLLFAFNFSPCNSYTDVKVSIPNCADYEVAFTTDDWKYGGWGQINHGTYPVQVDENGASTISLYLPARTAMVLREGELRQMTKELPVAAAAPEKNEKPAKKTAKKTASCKKS